MLAACGGNTAGNIQAPELKTAAPTTVATTTTPAGHTVEITGATSFKSLTSSSGVIAGKAGSTLYIGTIDQWDQGAPTAVTVDQACTDLSRAVGGFSLACPGKVLVIDEKGQEVKTFTVNGTPTSAAVTSAGASVTTTGSRAITWIANDGSTQETAKVGGDIVQSVIVDPDPASDSATEMAAVFDREQASLVGVYPGQKKDGSALRIGQGGGQIAGGENGVIVASATTVNAVDVFTGDGVLRKHMTIPTSSTPWGVAWDADANIVWVTCTGSNTVEGYDISSGAGVNVATLPTISDAESIALDGKGGLVISSPASGTVQLISAEDVQSATSSTTPTTWPVVQQ